jgi:hypothetical protein
MPLHSGYYQTGVGKTPEKTPSSLFLTYHPPAVNGSLLCSPNLQYIQGLGARISRRISKHADRRTQYGSQGLVWRKRF